MLKTNQYGVTFLIIFVFASAKEYEYSSQYRGGKPFWFLKLLVRFSSLGIENIISFF